MKPNHPANWMKDTACDASNINFEIQMKESQFNGEVSFNENEHHYQPIKVHDNFAKNPLVSTNRANPRKSINKALNILCSNRSTDLLEFNQDFQDYLALDNNNPNLNIVTFLGQKQIGKSFLIDFLVSKEEQCSSRVLSKINKPLINIPTYEVRGKSGQKVIYFDADSQISNSVFLWSYFLSSTVVLNLTEEDKKGEDQFLALLQHIKIRLNFEIEDLSLPHLIVIRRDCSIKQSSDASFRSKIASYDLFGDITPLSMAFPGLNAVTSKDIRDVSENLLNQMFVNDAINLSWVIKSTQPKTIKKNFLGSKIAALALDPLTKSVNKQGKINVNKIWSDIIETLSVGYYNFYLKKYSEQLAVQFSDEQPCDSYTLYKKLSKVRRSIDKKVEGFATIAGDQTFERYREKLKEKIASKQRIIREINKQKSIQKNDDLCKQLFSSINDRNCEETIKKYSSSNLDDGQTEVLLTNFEAVITNKLRQLQKAKNPSLKPSSQIQKLQRQLKDTQQKIQNERKANNQVVEDDFNKIQASIERKEKDLAELMKQLNKQTEAKEQRAGNRQKDVRQAETTIQQWNGKIQKQEEQISKLQLNRQSQAKEEIDRLNKQLKIQQERYQRLTQEINKLQDAKGKAVAEKKQGGGCCQVM